MSRTNLTIIAAALTALALYALRDLISVILIVAVASVMWLLPFAIVIVIAVGVIAGFARRHTAAQPSTTVAQRLQSQFARDSERGLTAALAQLPAWPISARITATAHELLTLQRGIARAEAEGVPASLAARYRRNTAQAADTLWQLASKVDAMAQNGVAYAVVAGMLEREDQCLAQLQESIHEAHEGIAVAIAAGIQSDALQDVEADLTALSRAIRTIETAHS